MQQNIKMFSSQVEDYKKYNLTIGEQYLVKKYFQGKKVLVLGCGAGRTLIPLHSLGYRVTGIDITPKMIEATRQKVKKLSIKVLKMDACKLRFEVNSFDIVFFPFNSIGCIYPDIYQCILEARRVMKKNGVFVFSTHSRFNFKALPRFFEGSYANYHGIILYRSTPLDWQRVRKYFNKVTIIPASKVEFPWEKVTLRTIVFKLFPFFDFSTYYICEGKYE
jgi:ubiquinone/menaquinone biosynthesis C-methylase UbiE